MPIAGNHIFLTEEKANSFLSRKLLANTIHRFEELSPGNLEKECIEEKCNYEEAREVFESDVDGLEKFWKDYTYTDSGMTEGDNSVALIMGILFGVVGFFIVVIFVYVVWMRKKGKLDKNLEESGQPYVPYPMLSYYSRRQTSAQTNNYETPLLDGMDSELAHGLSECYIERERLRLGEFITTGNFGEVREGKLKLRNSNMVDVAVKSLKSLDDPEAVEKFLREGVMMRGLDHPNILALYGVCVDSNVNEGKTSPLIVLPYMSNGDLRTYMRDGNIVLTVLDLIRYCCQVALGMNYLASKKFVHRDLAARNCMVGDSGVVKVADFGLSRDLFDRDYYKSSVTTQLPLKWMPPESIRFGRYDESSDVWSYGVVCWEIMTRGAIPYPTIQAVDILNYLGEGNRMEKPDCCPDELYKYMLECWKTEPSDRPHFKDLVQWTDDILQEALRSTKKRNNKKEQNSSADQDYSRTENHDRRDRPSSSKPQERPKAKPRTSLKKKQNERTDKHSQANDNKRKEKRNKKEKEANDFEEPSKRSSILHARRSSMLNLDVAEYNDLDEREITV